MGGGGGGMNWTDCCEGVAGYSFDEQQVQS